MSTNCLLTTLKGVVNNSNLEIYNLMFINIKASNNFGGIILNPTPGSKISSSNNEVKVEFLGNVYDLPFTIPTDVTYSGINIVANNNTLSADTDVYIENIYANKKFQGNRATISSNYFSKIKYIDDLITLRSSDSCFIADTINIDDLAGKTALTELFLNNNTQNNVDVKGNIENLEDCTALTTIRLDTQKSIIGSINTLGKLTALTEILLTYSRNITGSVEEFVEAQLSNNRYSRNQSPLTVNFFGSDVNFHNSKYPSDVKFVLTFTPTGCTITNYNTSATLATYDGSTWTYE